jgi:hypothetical protein
MTDMTDVPRYLQIGPREGTTPLWPAMIVTTEKQAMQRLPAVDSYDAAVERAVEHSVPLRISDDLVADMTSVGVGPASEHG